MSRTSAIAVVLNRYREFLITHDALWHDRQEYEEISIYLTYDSSAAEVLAVWRDYLLLRIPGESFLRVAHEDQIDLTLGTIHASSKMVYRATSTVPYHRDPADSRGEFRHCFDRTQEHLNRTGALNAIGSSFQRYIDQEARAQRRDQKKALRQTKLQYRHKANLRRLLDS